MLHMLHMLHCIFESFEFAAFLVPLLSHGFPGHLKICQNVLYKSALWLPISSRIVLGCCDKDFLHFHIVHDDGMPLATGISQSCHHSRVGELHSDFFGEERSTVSIEGEHGALNLKVPSPCIHDGTIVHAVNNDISNALGFQFRLFSEVARHLLGRSSRSESTGKTHHHHLLAPDDFRERHFLGRKAFVQSHIRHLITLGNSGSRPGRAGTFVAHGQRRMAFSESQGHGSTFKQKYQHAAVVHDCISFSRRP